MEVRVTLDFACSHCEQPVGVTVQCTGDAAGARDMTRLIACVVIPCPECKGINQLYFDPSGTVHAVEPHCQPRRIPEPSPN